MISAIGVAAGSVQASIPSAACSRPCRPVSNVCAGTLHARTCPLALQMTNPILRRARASNPTSNMRRERHACFRLRERHLCLRVCFLALSDGVIRQALRVATAGVFVQGTADCATRQHYALAASHHPRFTDMNDRLILKGESLRWRTNKPKDAASEGKLIRLLNAARQACARWTERRRVLNRPSTFTWMNSRGNCPSSNTGGCYFRRGPSPMLLSNNETNSPCRRTPVFAKIFRRCMRAVVRRIPIAPQQSSSANPSIR